MRSTANEAVAGGVGVTSHSRVTFSPDSCRAEQFSPAGGRRVAWRTPGFSRGCLGPWPGNTFRKFATPFLWLWFICQPTVLDMHCRLTSGSPFSGVQHCNLIFIVERTLHITIIIVYKRYIYSALSMMFVYVYVQTSVYHGIHQFRLLRIIISKIFSRSKCRKKRMIHLLRLLENACFVYIACICLCSPACLVYLFLFYANEISPCFVLFLCP